VNAINPSITQEPWTAREDHLLARLHEQHGNQWKKIGELMPNRSDNPSTG
jgi:hypothetical protein